MIADYSMLFQIVSTVLVTLASGILAFVVLRLEGVSKTLSDHEKNRELHADPGMLRQIAETQIMIRDLLRQVINDQR